MNKELLIGKKAYLSLPAQTDRRGQTVIEMVIGFALLTLGISFAILLVFGSQSLMIDRENVIRARAMAKEGLNATALIKEADWDSLSSGEHGLLFSGNSWQLNGTSDISGNLTRKVKVFSVDDNTKRVESEVSWQTDPIRNQKVTLVTLFTNWKNATPPPDSEDTGGSGISGDWTNPRTLGSLNLGPGLEPTGLDVRNKIVYMSARASNQNSPDFLIVNATNGDNPVLISSLHTGPGLMAVDSTEGFAYAANDDVNAQLQIINTSNLASPTLTSSYKIPGVSGSDGTGLSVFYTGSRVYLGLKKTTGPEFHIINVSNPTAPVLVGSYEVDDNVNDIYVAGDTAYLATDKGNAGLMVLNVSDGENIALLGQNYSSDTKSVYYISASLVLLGPGQDLYAANASNPANITTLGSINAGNTVNAISVRETLVFAGTSNSNREFQVINITNPANPTLHSFFNFPQVATGVDYEDNLVYVSVRSNDGLRIITSSP